MKFLTSKWRELCFVACAYLGISLIVTLPWALHTRELFGSGDAWQFLWNFWWTKTAILNHTNIFYTTMLHAPGGISLLFHTISLTSAIPAVFLQSVVSPIISYNILIFFHFVATGLAMYILVRKITDSRLAAFAAGHLLTFSQYHMMRSQGHLNLFTMEFIPLYVWCLLKMLEQRSWRYLLGAATCLALTAYADLYYLVYLLIFSFLFCIYTFFIRARKKFAIDMLLMGLVALLLIAPMVVPMIYGKFFSTNYDVYGHDPLVYSADLESFFVPGIYSLYAQNTASLWTHWTGYWESANYMGYVLLAVVAITLLLVRKREVWFWTIIAAVFGVLSLGPYLHIGGVAHRSVPLPYILLMKLPLFSLGGVAMRFYSMSLVALIILTGMGLAHIQKHWRRGYLIAPLLFVLMIAELYPAPVDSSAVIVPKFYTTLAQDTAVYNIMDFSQDPPKVLYYQTVHHKPLIGGYTSRPTLASQRFLDTTPVLSDLYSDDYKYQRTSPPADGKAILKSLNIKYVLVPAYHRSLRAYLGKMHLQVVSKDIEMMVYRVY